MLDIRALETASLMRSVCSSPGQAETQRQHAVLLQPPAAWTCGHRGTVVPGDLGHQVTQHKRLNLGAGRKGRGCLHHICSKCGHLGFQAQTGIRRRWPCQVITQGQWLNAAPDHSRACQVAWCLRPSAPPAMLYWNCLFISLPHETVSSLTAGLRLFISVYSYKLPQILSGEGKF